MALSDLKIRKAKQRDKPYKLYDSLGLFILVKPNGSKLWRHKYKLDGKEHTSALGKGGDYAALTGKYQRGGEGRLSTDKRYAARYVQAWMAETAQALSALAREWGTDPATLAVAWAAKHPAVSAPIISGRNAQQLEPSLKALSVCLTAEQYKQIEALSARPAPATDRLEEAGA